MKKMSHFFSTPQGKFIASIAAIIGLLFGYYFYAMSTGQVTETPTEVVISKTDHVRGAVDGTVTLVEFGDFQCPACGVYEPIVRQVLADNKKVLKFSFRQFPLFQIHQNALLAAKATEAAALQGKFWEMHDMLYDKQEEWSGALNAREFFVTYANILDMDSKKFLVDIESKTVNDKILAEVKEGEHLDVQGTPTFFLNGKKIDNPKDLASFNALIKEAAAAKPVTKPAVKATVTK